MISLKKHLDEWNNLPLDNPELEAYRSLLVTAGKASHLAVPDLGDNLHRKLSDLAASPSFQTPPERDERYAREVGNLAERLRVIAGVNDMAAIRRSIVEGVNALTACVERISQDGRMSLLRLSEQVEDYRSRLDKSERLSALDVVTGISNRRVFEEGLSTKVRASSRFCLILIDLDGFKR